MSDFRKYLNVYDFKTKLPGSKKVVNFKPITTGQLKKLLVYENVTNPIIIEEALDDLISSAVIDEEFDIGELTLQDRFFLLIEIRKKTNGENYKFNYTCGNCKRQSLQTINLDKLPFKKPKEDINCIIKLNDNISIKLDYIKRGNQKLAYSHIDIENLNDSQLITEMALVTNASGIEEIITPNETEANVSIVDKLYLLENISTEMYGLIRSWFDDNNYGIIFNTEVKCVCGHKEKIDVPLDNFFF